MYSFEDVEQKIAKFAEEYTAKRPNAALVVGIFARGNCSVKGFGTTKDPNGDCPNGQTLFEIGSITKVFTGILLARMVQDGTVQLNMPLSECLPRDVTVPRFDGKEMTLSHLATHTSGLPR